jgi:hypothetical protein
MSGGGAYYIDGSNRYVHAVTSTSDRNSWAYYVRQWNNWVNYLTTSFIPGVRGSSFDIQSLDMNAKPTSITAGTYTTTLNHLAVNATNANPANATYRFKVYLSTNSNISTSDTLLSSQQFSRDYAAMQAVRVNMVQVRIPANTPSGTYYLGVIYDNSTDSNAANNDTDGWDAQRITVTATARFQDVAPGSNHENSIYAIYNAGITQGCSQNPLMYCPEDPVTRAQMAAFIIRALEGEPPDNYCNTGSSFPDVNPNLKVCKYIKRLSERGITTGYPDGTYRPYNLVTRAQMATFIIRALEGDPPSGYCATGSPFWDVFPNSPTCKYIKRFFERGITTGYPDGSYRPGNNVTRRQMAGFLDRAFLD